MSSDFDGPEGEPDFGRDKWSGSFDFELDLGNIPPVEMDDPVPEKCRDCSGQCDLRNALLFSTYQKLRLEAMGKALMDEEFENKISGQVPNPSRMSEGMRRFVSLSLDRTDAQLEQLQEEIQALSESCEGPIFTKGSRNGMLYMAALCGSEDFLKEAEAYSPDIDYMSTDPEVQARRSVHATAHVWKEAIPDPKQFS